MYSAGVNPFKGLMGTEGVVEALPVPEGRASSWEVKVTVISLPEFFCVGSLRPLNAPFNFGERGGRTKRPNECDWQLCSKRDMNSLPPSTWIALIGNGKRAFIASRNSIAVVAVAAEKTSTTSQRLMTSRAVNCLRTTPGIGRRSKVSTWTRSPGSCTLYSLGFLTA